jgi:hypothetical protein
MAKFPDTEWQAIQVRLTVFPALEAPAKAPDWWQVMVGTEPSQDTADRRRHTSLISGDFGGGTLALRSAPDRIDWYFTAPEEYTDPAPSIVEIGPVSEALGQFSKLAEKWLGAPDVPDIARVGFGLVLHHPEPDHGAAYARLNDYLPVEVDPDWRDFFFQVNVHGKLAQEKYGLDYLNRLSRWSVLAHHVGRLTFTDQAMISGGPPSRFSLRLDLDISTPAESVVSTPRGELVSLYEELVTAGLAIARDGVAHEQYRLV